MQCTELTVIEYVVCLLLERLCIASLCHAVLLCLRLRAFQAKFLVDKDGNVVERNGDNPLASETKIQQLLAA